MAVEQEEEEHMICKDAAFDALNAVEQELMALQDIGDIFRHLQDDYPPPFYLTDRIAHYVQALRQHFNRAWDVVLVRSSL